MVYFINFEYWKIVCQAVVADVVTKGAFRLLLIADSSADAEIRFSRDRQSVGAHNHGDACLCMVMPYAAVNLVMQAYFGIVVFITGKLYPVHADVGTG
ncbi:hypothetical protein ADUPG1_003419, partial [Aduncisulcus paluster]